ncbi:protein kinase, putative [Cordyceps militaris CM01]|uniref:EKC/KEOPS complex subunit BUD32 n=1 Tax=Cordyceps militaris (strain CM01) TaxID=983644 RepID=G3JTW1_CORMM|nr:protein kinase, putative [Cordyceps militaris CM01]EGX88115.1 protein kinase, putative [Cordyceps militaris CM01]
MSPTTSGDDEIQYPSGFGYSDLVGWGTTGLVVLDRRTQTIIKTPFDPQDEENVCRLLRERQVYERLSERGGHEGLLSFIGPFESGIRLEYAPNHSLQSYNTEHDIEFAQRLRWATEIATALDFVHQAGVIHGDLTCANIFLDQNLHTKLADFAGSSIDGSPLLVNVTDSHQFFGPLVSVRADLFAFGSVLYEIMTGHAPYEGLDETEIRDRYQKREFPETDSLEVGTIIKRCWQGHYQGLEAVVKELRGM